MTEPPGLRERKKARIREALSATAIRLFLEKGFDQVSITEIAAAAEVSRRTLFAYFPAKEDLVLHRFADHEDDAATTVRTRRAGQSPLESLRQARLAALQQYDPITGLNDHPEVLAFIRLINDTESLAARLLQYTSRAINALEEALREAGIDALTARIMAAQVIVVERELAAMNYKCLLNGQSAKDRLPEAVQAVNHAYDLLSGGSDSMR